MSREPTRSRDLNALNADAYAEVHVFGSLGEVEVLTRHRLH
jgi:hypothetical protein